MNLGQSIARHGLQAMVAAPGCTTAASQPLTHPLHAGHVLLSTHAPQPPLVPESSPPMCLVEPELPMVRGQLLFILQNCETDMGLREVFPQILQADLDYLTHKWWGVDIRCESYAP